MVLTNNEGRFKKVAAQLAIEFTEQALPIFEAHRPNDNRPRAFIQAARDFNEGKITREELMTSRRDAAAAAAAAVAHAAAIAADAADAAAVAVAAIAADAADAARKKAKEKQAEIIRSILEGE